jgi:hypothetical protein
VHFGWAEQRVAERAVVIATAYVIHPERFPADRPMPAASRLLYPLLGSTRVSPAPLLRLDALRAVSAGPLLPKGI